jgi:hypothetical protein
LKVRRFQRKDERPPSARPERNSHGIWIVAWSVASDYWTLRRVLS